MPAARSQSSNSGDGFQSQHLPRVERVVKRSGLVVEHDVIRAGNTHDEGDARDAEQRQQDIHVILVGFGMVRVADIASHRDAEQLAAKVILQACADDLLAVVEVLGPDKSDDGIDEQRFEFSRYRISARFERLLIDAVMRVGRERAALTGLKIHDVVADRATLKTERRLAAFAQHAEVDAEALVGGFGPGNRLENEVDRRAAIDGLDAAL